MVAEAAKPSAAASKSAAPRRTVRSVLMMLLESVSALEAPFWRPESGVSRAVDLDGLAVLPFAQHEEVALERAVVVVAEPHERAGFARRRREPLHRTQAVADALARQ